MMKIVNELFKDEYDFYFEYKIDGTPKSVIFIDFLADKAYIDEGGMRFQLDEEKVEKVKAITSKCFKILQKCSEKQSLEFLEQKSLKDTFVETLKIRLDGVEIKIKMSVDDDYTQKHCSKFLEMIEQVVLN